MCHAIDCVHNVCDIAATKKCKATSRFDGMTSQFQNFLNLVLGLILNNCFEKKLLIKY